MRHFLLVSSCLIASLAAQRTWIVNAVGGPGVDFYDLPPAVAASSSGDTIYLVWFAPGIAQVPLNGGYTATVIDKPLRIVGVVWGTGSVPGAVGAGSANVSGTFTITGIPAEEKVILSQFTLSTGSSPVPTGIVIQNCAGDVVLEDLFVTDVFSVAPSFQAVINSCDNVSIRGCTFFQPRRALEITDSNVLLTTSVYEIGLPPPGQNPPGLLLNNSTVMIIGSNVRGAASTSSLTAGEGARLSNSRLRIGPGARLLGGNVNGNPAVAWRMPNPDSSAVELDARAIQVGSLAWPLAPQPTSATIDATYHSWAVANQPFGVLVAGPVGGFAFQLFGDMISPVPTPLGLLSVDPSTALVLDLVPLTSTYTMRVYSVPSGFPSAHAFVLQALTLSPSGQLALTVPTPLVVGYEVGTLPYPMLTSVTPPGALPGQLVTLTGSHFQPDMTATIAGQPVPLTVVSASQATLTMPPGVPCDAVIAVANPGLLPASSTVNRSPVVTACFPASGSSAGGASVLISGQYLLGATVTLNGTPMTFAWQTGISMSGTLPPGTPGPAVLEVTGPTGCTTQFPFTYQ